MPGKRILVTGGNGYVGRHLVGLLRDAHDVCVVDILRYGDWRFTEAERATLRLETVDIRDAEAVAALMADFRPEVVVHLAAVHYIPECEADPALAVSINVDGTLNLLLSCPERARFVLASSGAVYKPDVKPHCETTSELMPDDIYGLSKLHAEQYARALAAKRDLAAVIVRLFNVVGPGETNPHLLPELVAQLKTGRSTIELGNLQSRRDYVTVWDAALGFAATATGGAPRPGEACTVNLGTSSTHSVLEVVEKLRRISGIDFEIRQAASRLRRVDRPILAADTRHMATLFDWQPRFTVDDALTELWRKPDLAGNLAAQYR